MNSAGGERFGIARPHSQVEHAATLYAFGGTIRAVGKRIALEVPIVARIGINDAADLRRNVRMRRTWLDTAKARAIAHDHDFAVHVDPFFFEGLVVGGQAIVRIDERGGDVAIARIRVVRRDDIGIGGIGIERNRKWLGQLRGEAGGLQSFRGRRSLGSGQQRVERFDLGVEAILLRLSENPFGGLCFDPGVPAR